MTPFPLNAMIVALSLVTLPALADTAQPASDEPVAIVQAVKTQQGPVSSILHGYGVVGTTSSLTQSINLPYLARVEQVLVNPGQRVAKGAALLNVTADPGAVLASAQARSTLNDARAELARVKSQFDLRLVTNSQLAAAQKAVTDAQEALNAQEETGAKAGTIVVRAPQAGTVLQITSAQGDQVAAGTAMMLLTQPSDGKTAANMFFGIEPADAAQVHKGDAVTLKPVASNLQGTVTGTVVSIGQSIDSTSQLITLGANVALQSSAFIPGMHVTADVRTQPQTLWQVPEAAVLGSPDNYLFQIKDGHARRVDIKIAADDGQQVGVTGDLDASQQVVTVGSAQLSDGMAVQLADDKASGDNAAPATGAPAQ